MYKAWMKENYLKHGFGLDGVFWPHYLASACQVASVAGDYGDMLEFGRELGRQDPANETTFGGWVDVEDVQVIHN